MKDRENTLQQSWKYHCCIGNPLINLEELSNIFKTQQNQIERNHEYRENK